MNFSDEFPHGFAAPFAALGNVSDPLSFTPPPFSSPVEDIRLRLRGRVLESTYLMAKAVLGFKDITPNTHGPFARFIETPDIRKMGLAPRDHLKTSVWTIADTCRRIAKNPNIRVLIGNETSTNASHFLRRIEAVWERNRLFQWLFPEVIPDWSKVKKWSETEMLVPRANDYPESTVEAIGVGGAIVSRHYDLIKLDDLVGKEASESSEVMRKTIDWYLYCESLVDDPNVSEIQTYGTRWANHDLYRHILENELEDTMVFLRSAITVSGGALWPEKFPLETLHRIRRKIGSFKFSCQYLNRPHDPEQSSLRLEWLRYYQLEDGDTCQPEFGTGESWRNMRRFARIDPAISEEDQACESAIEIDGVDKLDRKFLLEDWAGRVSPGKLFEKVFELDQKWNPDAWGVEAVVMQKYVKYYLEKECRERGVYLNFVDLKPEGRKSKKSRVRSMAPYAERGEIFVRRDQKGFLEQYEEFPTGVLIDRLDAWAYGPQMWEMPLEETESEDAQERREYQHSSYNEGRDPHTGY